LSDMLLGVVRQLVVGQGKVPLGGLFAPLRLTDISYLWSLELWGLFTSRHNRHWRIYTLALLAPSLVILAALVGPASAMLMIPRTETHGMWKGLVLMDAQSTLFPQRVASL